MSQNNLSFHHARVLHSANDTATVNSLNFLAKYHINANHDSAHYYVNHAKTLAEKINYQKGVGYALLTVGILANDEGDFPKALENILQVIEISREIKDAQLEGGALLNLGNFYIKTGNIDKALQTYKEGILHSKKNQLLYLEASLTTSYGMALRRKGDLDSALYYYEKVLEIHHNILHDSVVIAAIYNNVASIYFEKQDEQTAENYLLKSYEINKRMGNERYMLMNLANLAELVGTPDGNLAKSQQYFEEAIALAKKTNSKEALESIYNGMSKVFYNHHKYKEAFDYVQIAIAYKDSVMGDETKSRIMEISENYKTRAYNDSLKIKNQELQLSKQNEEALQLKASKTKWQLIGTLAISGGILVALLFLYRHSKNQKKINALLQEKNEEITRQKIEIEVKNTELTDSINYAKRIQTALLPSTEFLQKTLGDHFLIFKPKDIVSGDFYWVKHTGNKHYFAVADCTGHGVPGAMVSMLGFETIDSASLSEPNDAAVFMQNVNQSLVNSLTARHENNNEDEKVKDGMDVSLCIVTNRNKLSYCGANNEIFVIRHHSKTLPEENEKIKLSREGDYVLIELKPTKRPVGLFDAEKEFTSVDLDLYQGDMFYLFSDGYADQFGGDKGKKMKTSVFRDVLIKHAHLSMSEQKVILENHLENWQQNFSQLDDITVLGVNVE